MTYSESTTYTSSKRGTQFMTSTSTSVSSFSTPAGFQWVTINDADSTSHDKPSNKTKAQNKIAPGLYFSYIKSKLNTHEIRKHEAQINKLTKLIIKSGMIGQIALQEKFAHELSICVRELEAYVYGIKYYVDKSVINKYKNKVKDVKVIMCDLEEYPRIIENKIHRKIKNVVKKNLFDKYYVLYLDYSNGTSEESKPIKTTKSKIIEKDPILWGVYNELPDRLYFILDWIDEYCDLTFDELMDRVRDENPDFTVDEIALPDQEYVDRIIANVKANDGKLDETTRENFKQLAEEIKPVTDDLEELKDSSKELSKQVGFFRRLCNKLKRK